MGFRANLLGNSAYQSQIRGDYDKAKLSYESALAEGMDKPNLIDSYAILLLHEGNFAKSIEMFGKALKHESTPDRRYNIRTHRALAYLKSGDLKRAKAALEDIIQRAELEPAYETLAYFYVMTDDEKAREFNEKATNLFPENAIILDCIGQYYIDKGHPEIAREFLKDAYEISDDKKDINYHMAQVALSEGDKKKALEYLHQAKSCSASAVDNVSSEEMDKLYNELTG